MNIGILENMPDKPEPGSKWKHWKGGVYIVMCIAICSETGKDLVIYKSVEDDKIYSRPLEMWHEYINKNRSCTHMSPPRFRKIS